MSPDKFKQPSVYSQVIGVAGILLAHSISLAFVMFVLVKIVPTYAIVLEDFEVTLPIATQQVLMWSEFWVAFWYLIFFVCMAIDVVIVAILAFAVGSSRLTSFYSHLYLLSVCTLVVYISIWLAHPVYRLLEVI